MNLVRKGHQDQLGGRDRGNQGAGRSYTGVMAAPGGTGYEISRPTGVCAATGRVIAVGEQFVAALAEDEGGERLERQDFSIDAWESGARPEPPLRLFGHWRATMPEPGDRKRPYIDDAALVDLFGQLEGASEPGRVSFRYLLALMLIRKRLLKYEGMKVKGGPTADTVEPKARPAGPAAEDGLKTRPTQFANVMLVRTATPAGAIPAEVVEVVDPGMDEAAIAAAVEELSAVLADGGGGAS